jgi:DNA-binding protein Fis
MNSQPALHKSGRDKGITIFPPEKDLVRQATETLVTLLEKYRKNGLSAKRLFDILERNLLIEIMLAFKGNQRRVAEYLRVKPTTLHYQLKKHKICVRDMFRIKVSCFLVDEDLMRSYIENNTSK